MKDADVQRLIVTFEKLVCTQQEICSLLREQNKRLDGNSSIKPPTQPDLFRESSATSMIESRRSEIMNGLSSKVRPPRTR